MCFAESQNSQKGRPHKLLTCRKDGVCSDNTTLECRSSSAGQDNHNTKCSQSGPQGKVVAQSLCTRSHATCVSWYMCMITRTHQTTSAAHAAQRYSYAGLDQAPTQCLTAQQLRSSTTQLLLPGHTSWCDVTPLLQSLSVTSH
jgi:hypothetical protein